MKIPVADLKPGQLVKGVTIAELGNGNRPLDMIVYQKNGKDYLLMANNKRGVMKVSLEGVAKAAPITTPIKNGGTAGLPYETIDSLKGVEQLDVFDKDHALVLSAPRPAARPRWRRSSCRKRRQGERRGVSPP